MNKVGKSHKKQHFVPQCYTKAWHDLTAPAGPANTPYVWVFDKDGSNPHRKAPVNLFTETDIYTIMRPNGERDLRLEHGFQELEDKFTRIRNLKFSQRKWPNAEDVAWVLGFVAIAQARTVAYRDFHREQWGDIRRRIEDLMAEFDEAFTEQKQSMARIGRVSSGSGKEIRIEDVRRLEDQAI